MNEQRLTFTLPRIDGQAELDIYYGSAAAQAKAYVRMPQVRGFDVLAIGRPAEELPRLVSRISALCPWHHHLAATLAVEDALNITVPPAARTIRELMLLLAHITDKILHLFIMSAPDIDSEVENGAGVLFLLGHASMPHVGMEARHCVSRMFKALSGHSWGGDFAVIGGQSCAVYAADMDRLQCEMEKVRTFCLEAMEQAREKLLRPLHKQYQHMDNLPFASLGCVDDTGALCLNAGPDARLRLVQPDGSRLHFAPHDYQQHIVEEYADWTRASFPRLRTAPPLQLDPATAQGVFRVGPLARIHACDSINTPLAQRELEVFRAEHGPLPQNTLLYHWARLIELLHCIEKADALLQALDLEDDDVRAMYLPDPTSDPSEGFAHLEAPRGSLFYRINLDANQCISACDILTPTNCNNAALNLSLSHAVRQCLADSEPAPALNAEQIHMVSSCVRAYDPCPACAAHVLSPLPASHSSPEEDN